MRVAPGVEAYGAGGFRIAGSRYEGSVLILDDKVLGFSPRALGEVDLLSLEPIFAHPEVVELVILGAGARTGLASRTVRQGLAAAGVGLETLSTAQAVRLYNYLAQEGRRVAAVLLALP